MLEFVSRIRQLAEDLKSMEVTIEDSEMAVALLNGLPGRFDGIISVLNALRNDEKLFTFEFAKIRCQQKKQLHESETKRPNQTLRTLLYLCVHCGKHNNRNRCYKKYPYLAPPYWPRRNNNAFLLRHKSSQSSEFSLAAYFPHFLKARHTGS